MLCRINDFKYKDVVNAGDGVRLGYVGDVELDTESAALTAIVIRGRYRPVSYTHLTLPTNSRV